MLECERVPHVPPQESVSMPPIDLQFTTTVDALLERLAALLERAYTAADASEARELFDQLNREYAATIDHVRDFTFGYGWREGHAVGRTSGWTERDRTARQQLADKDAVIQALTAQQAVAPTDPEPLDDDLAAVLASLDEDDPTKRPH